MTNHFNFLRIKNKTLFTRCLIINICLLLLDNLNEFTPNGRLTNPLIIKRLNNIINNEKNKVLFNL